MCSVVAIGAWCKSKVSRLSRLRSGHGSVLGKREPGHSELSFRYQLWINNGMEYEKVQLASTTNSP
jgi:hypothetical protein